MIRRVKHWKETKFEKFLNLTWKELRFDFKNMINWLLFYKTKGKADKVLHIIEVCIFYVFLQLAWRGV
jgi:hypothetical protein